jgi:hypothetical protein
MSPANGHAQQDSVPTLAPTAPLASGVLPIPAERINELVAALEVPFVPSQIEWRVMNTTKNQQPMRGQVVPYADQRAYTDRLNALFTPAGWTRKYTIHTSANFSKTFAFGERVRLKFESTFTNLPNHVNYAPPSVDVSSPSTFGQITSGQTAENAGNRTGQVALRIEF